MTKRLYVWLGALFLVRVLLSFWTPIVADESYYLLWTQHLATSYVDHPALTAWFNFLFITIFQEPLLAIRLASLAAYCITCFFLYRIGRQFFTKQQTIYMTLLFMLIPYHYVIGITMQVEQLLISFSTAALYYFIRLIKSENTIFFIPLAIMCGLACLAKYTALLIIFGMLVYLLFTKNRSLLNSFHFILALTLFALLLLPIVMWNLDYNWVSFQFHSNRISSFTGFDAAISFVLNQILYLSPVVVIYFFKTIYIKKKSQYEQIFLSLSLICWIPFFVLSFVTTVYSHWTAISTIPMILFISYAFKEKLALICRYQTIFTLFVVIVLILATPLTNPINVFKNYTLKTKFEDFILNHPTPLHIYSDTHGSVGILSYYSKQAIYFPKNIIAYPSRWGYNQFSIWDQPPIKKDDSILFFGRLNSKQRDVIEDHFELIEEIKFPTLTILEGYLANRTYYLFKKAKLDFTF